MKYRKVPNTMKHKKQPLSHVTSVVVKFEIREFIRIKNTQFKDINNLNATYIAFIVTGAKLTA